jgi:hypothetical protein
VGRFDCLATLCILEKNRLAPSRVEWQAFSSSSGMIRLAVNAMIESRYCVNQGGLDLISRLTH